MSEQNNLKVVEDFWRNVARKSYNFWECTYSKSRS